MKKKESLPPTPRKKIAQIVTWAALNAEHRKLNAQLRNAAHETPPPKSAAEQQQPRKMFEHAHRVAGAAALTYLRKRDMATCTREVTR